MINVLLLPKVAIVIKNVGFEVAIVIKNVGFEVATVIKNVVSGWKLFRYYVILYIYIYIINIVLHISLQAMGIMSFT